MTSLISFAFVIHVGKNWKIRGFGIVNNKIYVPLNELIAVFEFMRNDSFKMLFGEGKYNRVFVTFTCTNMVRSLSIRFIIPFSCIKDNFTFSHFFDFYFSR